MTQEEVLPSNTYEALNNETLRANRTVLNFQKKGLNHSVTVFTGLFNGEQYLPGIIETIENQTSTNVLWLLADNNSSDHTWEKLQAWASATTKSVIIVKNVVNLGGAGSLYVNLDLAQGQWVSSMHQDDVYKSNFVDEMLDGVRNAGEDVVFGFSDMARISDQNIKLGAFPPGIWAVPDLEPATLFLALIRNHCIPWPAFIVRKELLISTEPPWYSTAFSDTEATLQMVAKGKFVHIPKELMFYRDNPGSESRSIVQSDINLGVALSLLRVFQTKEFRAIYFGITPDLKLQFTEGLISALECRLQKSPYQDLVIAQAMEQIDTYSGHSNIAALQRLGQIYSNAGAKRSAELIKSVAKISGGNLNYELSEVSEDNAKRLTSRKSWLSTLSVGFYTRFGNKIPYSLRRYAWTKVLRIMGKRNPSGPWNYDWKKL